MELPTIPNPIRDEEDAITYAPHVGFVQNSPAPPARLEHLVESQRCAGQFCRPRTYDEISGVAIFHAASLASSAADE